MKDSINYHALDEENTLKVLKTTKKGLTNHEAEHRRQTYGFNELKAEKTVSPIKIFLEQFASPLIWILLFALIVSIILGEVTDGKWNFEIPNIEEGIYTLRVDAINNEGKVYWSEAQLSNSFTNTSDKTIIELAEKKALEFTYKPTSASTEYDVDILKLEFKVN